MHTLTTAVTQEEAQFIQQQLPAQARTDGDWLYLSFETEALLLRAEVLVCELRYPPQRTAPAALHSPELRRPA